MQAKAYCFAGGVVEIGQACPSGALPLFLRGDPVALKNFLQGVCRLAYDNETLLVPGVPEAPDQTAGVKALQAWLERIRPSAIKAGLLVEPRRGRR